MSNAESTNTIEFYQSKLWRLLDSLRGALHAEDSMQVIIAIAVIAKVVPTEFDQIHRSPKTSQHDDLLRLISFNEELKEYDFSFLKNTLLTSEAIQQIIYFVYEINDYEIFADISLEVMREYLGKKGCALTDNVIIEIVKQLVGDISHAKVYDGAAGLCALISRLNTAKLVLEDVNYTSASLGKNILLLKGKDAAYAQNNSLLNTRPSAQADWVITQPPWGLRLNPKEQEILKTATFLQFDKNGKIPATAGDALWVQHALYNMNKNGRGILLLPQGWLFRGGYDAKLREYLLEHDFIESIISLPAALLGITSIPSVLLVLNKNKSNAKKGIVNFVDASNFGVETKRKKQLSASEMSLIVSLTKGEQPEHENFKAVLLPEIYKNNSTLSINQYIKQDKEIEIPDLKREKKELAQVQSRFNKAQAHLQKILINSVHE